MIWLKKNKHVVVSLCNLCLILVVMLLLVYSFGWFSSNDKVKSTGMQIMIAGSSNLIISDDLSDMENLINVNELNEGSPYIITTSTTFTKFYPCTRDDTLGYASNLKRVMDEYSQYIDIKTGVTSQTIEYVECLENPVNDKLCYKDYTICIASHGKALVDATLKFSIGAASITASDNEVINLLDDTSLTYESLKAASVDLYEVNSDDTLTFLGTLNVAGLNVNDGNNGFDKGNKTYDATDVKSYIYLIGSESTTGTIPLPDNALNYVLRVYFDGALLESDTKTFINSSTLDCSPLTLTFAFEATGIDAQ